MVNEEIRVSSIDKMNITEEILLENGFEQTEMMEHCIRQIQKHPFRREGLEHFVFLNLLKACPESEYKRIVERYKYIDKTL